jgi:lipopolysaccharide transport system permease protein
MAAPGASSETLVKGAPTAAEQQSATHGPVPGGSHVTAIGPSRGFALRLSELWAYRELFYFLMWRDLKVRYKRTAIGASWAVIQPLMTMIVFTVFFGTLAKLPSDNLPYPIFSFSGLLPWTMFVYALNNSSMSVVASQGLITKVYFPRIIVPLASALAGVLDFLIGLVVLAGMMAWYGIVPPLAVVTLPLFTVFAFTTALAFGLWFSALNVRYRDVQLLVPFLIQIWLFLTPIAYSTSLVPPSYRLIYGINPMAGVVEGFRWALLGRATGFGPLLGVSVGVVLLTLVTGAYYFRRTERLFADII